jgi:hypothetical protein
MKKVLLPGDKGDTALAQVEARLLRYIVFRQHNPSIEDQSVHLTSAGLPFESHPLAVTGV